MQLNTRTKMFCGCEVTFGEPPNTHVCPVCLGHPGVLPVTNEKAVEYATRIALALDCRIAERTIFHRKNYFYPDLPKAYQISQYDLPLGIGGHLDVELEDGSNLRVGITRVHMEEDAGKLVHAGGASGRIDGADYSLVDFNRGGTPLVEIVSEPDISTPEQARAFLTQLRSLRAAAGRLRRQHGGGLAALRRQRVGAPAGRAPRHQDRAQEHELLPLPAAGPGGRDRAADRRPGDGRARSCRRRCTSTRPPARCRRLRSKEEAHDYRYFPEPDLPPIELDEAYVERVRAALPELPAARKERLIGAVRPAAQGRGAARRQQAPGRLLRGPGRRHRRPAHVGQLGAGRPLRLSQRVRARGGASARWAPPALAELLGLVTDGTLSGKMAKEVFEAMTATGQDAKAIVAEKGLGQISDTGELEAIVARIVAANPGPAEEFRQGRDKVLGFFVGQVMKETRGQANPQLVNELLRKHLPGRGA